MKLLPILILSLLPSCKALDGTLGLGGNQDRSEEAIQSAEGAVRTVGDIALPGLGGALAVLFGLGARAYVKRRQKPA